MAVEPRDWIVAQAGSKWYACHVNDDGVPDNEIYDPEDVKRLTARFNRTRLTKARAQAVVDKMNGPRGDLTEVSGT